MNDAKFKNLDVWKKSFIFVKNVYKVLDCLPDYEKFGLKSQIIRCSVSIPSNIAEGSLRNSDKEFIRFLNIALGSTAELETQLLLLVDLEYVDSVDELVVEIENIRKMIYSLIRYLRGRH